MPRAQSWVVVHSCGALGAIGELGYKTQITIHSVPGLGVASYQGTLRSERI